MGASVEPDPLDAPGFTRPAFSLRDRLRRAAWQAAWTVLARWTPPPFHAWRSLVLRCFGARLGRDVHVYGGARVWAPWLLVMDDESCLADGVDCYNQARIRIGRRAIVSQRAFLCAGTHDHGDPEHALVTAPIDIGERAWICAQAIVGPGVSIGAGAVVGAGAVAMRDQPEWMICAGNPCVPLKPRKLRGSAFPSPE